ncbi:MAG: hypothetical protein HC844_12270 [Tabrizicola sp.]|nr:hypothetical protein [Tabrizicola sp.]
MTDPGQHRLAIRPGGDQHPRGSHRHRGIGDLMRYAALNQDAGLLSRYGDSRPMADELFRQIA